MAVLRAIRTGAITPIYSSYLLDEYREVMARDKFRVDPVTGAVMMRLFTDNDRRFEPDCADMDLPDPDDAPIYFIAMQTQDIGSYLVTGNRKHFPDVDFVVTPREMMEILESEKQG